MKNEEDDIESELEQQKTEDSRWTWLIFVVATGAAVAALALAAAFS